jgi:hypothetical protein
MTTPCTTPNLAAALVNAQNKMEAVAKDSTNKFHNYKYASSEDIIDASREVLSSNGLSFTVEAASYTALPGEVVWNGVAILGMTFVLEHTSGEQRRMTADIPVCPEKGRPLDKALFAARTEGLGYGLRDLLLIPRKNAEDISGRKDRDADFLHEAAQQQASAAGARAPAPGPRANGSTLSLSSFTAAAPKQLLALLTQARAVEAPGIAEQAFASRVAVLLGAGDRAMYDELGPIASESNLIEGSPADLTLVRAFKLAKARVYPGAAA